MTILKKYSGLAGWLVISFLAGSTGAYFEPGIWYEMLKKPFWTPPDWVFPVIWPILYTCMGTAAWLIWKEYGLQPGRQELKWFGIQLGLNAAWPWIFFDKHLIGTALGEILLLWIAILFTMMLFWRKKASAGWLIFPYFIWVSYAVTLNFAIWQLN